MIWRIAELMWWPLTVTCHDNLRLVKKTPSPRQVSTTVSHVTRVLFRPFSLSSFQLAVRLSSVGFQRRLSVSPLSFLSRR